MNEPREILRAFAPLSLSPESGDAVTLPLPEALRFIEACADGRVAIAGMSGWEHENGRLKPQYDTDISFIAGENGDFETLQPATIQRARDYLQTHAARALLVFRIEWITASEW